MLVFESCWYSRLSSVEETSCRSCARDGAAIADERRLHQPWPVLSSSQVFSHFSTFVGIVIIITTIKHQPWSSLSPRSVHVSLYLPSPYVSLSLSLPSHVFSFTSLHLCHHGHHPPNLSYLASLGDGRGDFPPGSKSDFQLPGIELPMSRWGLLLLLNLNFVNCLLPWFQLNNHRLPPDIQPPQDFQQQGHSFLW